MSISTIYREAPGKKTARQYFKVCFCFKRMFRIKTAEPPDEIKHLFSRFSDNGTMTIDHLRGFLRENQGENEATMDHAKAIFDSLKHLNIFQRKGLHLEAFFRYLLGNLNGPLVPSQVYHDMNAPLAHYFIFTGHNSYLTGNQLTSDSSTIPIRDALKKGVRVIELDLWPNSRGDDVEVRHGGTLTAPVELRDCLKTIKENAFHASKYPVVITFEDHITRHLQAKVAKMVDRIFGPMLYRPMSPHTAEFPSPDSLKEKVLISTKPPEYPDSQHKKIQSDDQDDSEEEDDVLGYRNLISIHAGKPKGGLENWFTDHGHARRLSLSEQELEESSRVRGTDIIRFTQKNLLRIYPKGTRLDSSNYNPMIGWMHGAQMVAFNMQGHGKYLRIMEGMFKANGGCGYIKKPEFLLTVDQVFDPKDRSLPVRKTLRVVVYMGEGWHEDFRHTDFDLYSPPDFFVKVGIVGVPADSIMKTTRIIEDQWIPAWNDEFVFPLTVPELAILRIETLEYDTSGNHDFGGQTCLPLSELRTGIRAVPLSDRIGKQYKSVKLLMRFEFF